jgi:hypothetical protein
MPRKPRDQMFRITWKSYNNPYAVMAYGLADLCNILYDLNNSPNQITIIGIDVI